MIGFQLARIGDNEQSARKVTQRGQRSHSIFSRDCRCGPNDIIPNVAETYTDYYQSEIITVN